MRKRVVFIVGTLQTGGIERSVTDWCMHLINTTDWQPFVICVIKRNGPFLNTLREAGVRVDECKLHVTGFTKRLKILLQEIDPEVVHSQVAFSLPWQILAILRSGKRKIIFTQQNEYQNWSPMWANLRLRIYFAIFFRYIHHYTCVSISVRKSLSSLTGLSASKFKIIPNGVNTDVFNNDAVVRTQERKALNINDDVFVIGMVGRFNPQKGHIFLIEAVRELSLTHKNFKVLLIGVGEMENEIRHLVTKYNLSDWIIFYGQSLEVHQILQVFDCFVLPSLWEGMPLAILEAMATGLPVIATDVAGTREVLQNEINGLLIPSKDSTAITRGLIRLIDDVSFRKQLGDSALNFVRQNYSVVANIDSYLKLYEN